MKPSDRRQIILKTAYKLFNQYGFHPTGIDLIIKESSTSKATLYKYFKNKETLILEVLKTRHNNVITNIHTAIKNSTQNEFPILAIFDIYSNWFKQTSFYGCFFHKAGSEFSDKNSPINQFSVQSKKELLELISLNLHQQNHDRSTAKVKARGIMMLLDGAIVDAQTFQNKDAAIEAKHIALKMLQS